MCIRDRNTDVKQQLQSINDTLATKATADSVRALDEKAATKDALAALDASKADKSALETLKQDVGDGVKKKLEDVNTTLATKADKETTQAALATKADKKALDALDIDVRTKALTINAALEGKADKQTTDTFANQATKQLKALREWAESTLQSKMQEKYNEGFSKGKQEGGDISDVTKNLTKEVRNGYDSYSDLSVFLPTKTYLQLARWAMRNDVSQEKEGNDQLYIVRNLIIPAFSFQYNADNSFRKLTRQRALTCLLYTSDAADDIALV